MFEHVSMVVWNPVSKEPPMPCRDEHGACSVDLLLAGSSGSAFIGRYSAGRETFVLPSGLVIDWVRFWASIPLAPCTVAEPPAEIVKFGRVVIDQSS